MIIKCLGCGKDFYKDNFRSRFCGCTKINRRSGFTKYLADMSRYYQDPIYQHFRLDSSESLACEMRFVRPIITVISKPNKKKY